MNRDRDALHRLFPKLAPYDALMELFPRELVATVMEYWMSLKDFYGTGVWMQDLPSQNQEWNVFLNEPWKQILVIQADQPRNAHLFALDGAKLEIHTHGPETLQLDNMVNATELACLWGPRAVHQFGAGPTVISSRKEPSQPWPSQVPESIQFNGSRAPADLVVLKNRGIVVASEDRGVWYFECKSAWHNPDVRLWSWQGAQLVKICWPGSLTRFPLKVFPFADFLFVAASEHHQSICIMQSVALPNGPRVVSVLPSSTWTFVCTKHPDYCVEWANDTGMLQADVGSRRLRISGSDVVGPGHGEEMAMSFNEDISRSKVVFSSRYHLLVVCCGNRLCVYQ